jgi:hypothetical protein
MMKRDDLWLWGQDAGSHHATLNNCWKLPGENKMGPVEGSAYLGVPNICRVAMGNLPAPPFFDEAEKLKDIPKVVWSVIGDGGSGRTDGGNTDLQAVIDVAKVYPNIIGGIMDDFFSDARMQVYTADVIRDIAAALHEQNLNLWTVLYTHELTKPIAAHLAHCDVITFWTWNGGDLTDLEDNLTRLEETLTAPKPIYQGVYFWNYGASRPLTMEQMEHQLETGYRLYEAGRIKGMVFCSNCIADIGLETVAFTRKWLDAHCV